MAFQTENVPGLDNTSNSSSDTNQTPLLFAGARGVAVRILSRAESSDSYIEKLIELELRMSEWSNYDRALLIELVYGTLRWQSRLDWVLTGFYHGEFTKCIVPVKNAMRIALYQILMLSKIPPNVAVTECANTIRRIKDDKSANIIAGVLKNILRNVEGIRYPSKDDNIQLFYSVTLSHPLWMVKRWCERYGDEVAEKILSANNERPSLFLCANTLKMSKEQMMIWLKENECTFEAMGPMSNLVRINGLQNVDVMEASIDGRVFKCRAADFLVAKLANISKHMSLLCLGDSNSLLLHALVAHSANEASYTAVSAFDSTIPKMKSRLNQLGFDAVKIVKQDSPELDKLTADIVVLESTVSGLGLLNSRPELRWKLQVDSVRKSANIQRLALKNAASHVAPGGALLYCAASFEVEETADIVSWFLSENSEFSLDDASQYVEEQYCNEGYVQSKLYLHKMDNLFVARLVRGRA